MTNHEQKQIMYIKKTTIILITGLAYRLVSRAMLTFIDFLLFFQENLDQVPISLHYGRSDNHRLS